MSVKYIEGDTATALKASWRMGKLPCALCDEPTIGRISQTGSLGQLEVTLVTPICPKCSKTVESLLAKAGLSFVTLN